MSVIKYYNFWLVICAAGQHYDFDWVFLMSKNDCKIEQITENLFLLEMPYTVPNESARLKISIGGNKKGISIFVVELCEFYFFSKPAKQGKSIWQIFENRQTCLSL